MSNKYMVLLLTAMILSMSICRAENVNNSGYLKYINKTVNNIQENGYVVLEKTDVLGHVQVNGAFKADRGVMMSLEVNGQADLRDCVISGKAVMNGFLDAVDTKFQNDLIIISQKVVLNRCSFESLTVRAVQGSCGIQVVDLRDETTVIGKIIVESGTGEIWVSSNSEILTTQVLGARIYVK